MFTDPAEPSSLQTTGPTPKVLTGAFTQLIRHTFSSPDYIEDPQLKGYLWSENPKISRILIEPTHRWKSEDIQQRPAVMVKRGPLQFTQMGIGDVLHNRVAETGFEENQHIVAGAGTHTAVCLGTSGNEAEAIAEEVWKTFLSFLAQIRQQFCLGKFIVNEVGPISTSQESHTHFVVPVSVQYMFAWQWSVLRRTPEWTRVSANVTTDFIGG